MKKILILTQNLCFSAILFSICTTFFAIYYIENANSKPLFQIQNQFNHVVSDNQPKLNNLTQATLSTIVDTPEVYRPKLNLCTKTSEVIEGQVITFDVVYHETPPNRIDFDFPVFVKVTQAGNFIHGTPPSEIVIPKYLYGWSFDVETKDDEISEMDGRISASIIPNERYEVINSSTCHNVAHVIVQDNDEANGLPPSPELSIYNYGSKTIFQGGVVNLKINATRGIETELPISVKVSSSNDQIFNLPEIIAVVLPTWTTEFEFEYQTTLQEENNKSSQDANTTLTFEIQPNDGYVIAESPHNSATVELEQRYFTPQLKIVSLKETITEGEQAVFKIEMFDDNQRSAAIANDLLVNLKSDITGIFVPGPMPKTINFESGKSHIELLIPTFDDRIYESKGHISVSINPGEGYSSTTALPTIAEVTILDNDTPIGGASILSKQDIVTEGDTAYFEVSVPTASDQDRVIYYDVRTELFALPKGSNRKSQTFNQSVRLPAHQTKTTLSYQTIDDEEDNEIGLLTVYLRPDKNSPSSYNMANSRTWAAVEYADNDGLIPTIRLETFYDYVEDGAFLPFNLIASTPPDINNPITIDSLEIINVETGNPYPGYLIPEVITIDQDGIGEGWVMLDPFFEKVANKKIAVILKNDLLHNYKVAPEPNNSLVLDVKPNNVFSMAIENNKNEFVKGETIELVISLNRAYEDSVTVPIQISNPMNFSLWRFPKSVTFPIGVDQQTIHLKINHDNVAHTDGYITISLVSEKFRRYLLDKSSSQNIKITNSSDTENIMSEPRISVSAQVVKFALENSQDLTQTPTILGTGPSKTAQVLPVISVEAVVASINEGENAEFLIMQSNPSSKPVEIKLNITESGNFLTNQFKNSVLLNPSQDKETLVLQTFNDDLAESDGMITVHLLPNESYQLGKNYYAFVNVSDRSDRDLLNEELVITHNIINPVVLRNMESNLLDATRESSTLQRNKNERFNFQILGQSSFKEIIKAGRHLKNYHGPLWKALLNQTSFGFDFYPVEDSKKSLLFWGHGINSNLNYFSVDQTKSMNGEVVTNSLGIDSLLTSGTNTGISISQTNANAHLDWSDKNKQIQYSGNWIGFHPFFKWHSPLSGNNFQIVSSYRLGQTKIGPLDEPVKQTNSQILSANLNGRWHIFSTNTANENVSSELNVLGDGLLSYHNNDDNKTFLVQSQLVNSRLAFESKNWFRLSNAAIIQLYFQLGLDLDVEDSQFISAWDLTGGTDYIATPHLNITTKGRALFSESNQLSDFLFAASLSFDRNLNNKGLKLNVSARNVHTFEDNLMMVQKRNQKTFRNDLSEEWNLNSEIGYGIQFDDQFGTFDTYSRYSLANQNDHTLALGSRIAINSNLQLDATVSRKITPNTNEYTEIRFNGKISW